MFKIDPDPTFQAEVGLTVPGQKEAAKVKLTFKYKTRSEAADFSDRLKDLTFKDACSEIVTGWDGVDVDFSPENLEKLIDNYVPSGGEVIGAYFRELGESRAKN